MLYMLYRRVYFCVRVFLSGYFGNTRKRATTGFRRVQNDARYDRREEKKKTEKKIVVATFCGSIDYFSFLSSLFLSVTFLLSLCLLLLSESCAPPPIKRYLGAECFLCESIRTCTRLLYIEQKISKWRHRVSFVRNFERVPALAGAKISQEEKSSYLMGSGHLQEHIDQYSRN